MARGIIDLHVVEVINNMPTALFLYVTALLLVFVIVFGSNTRYNTPLRKVPGPFVASFTRLWKISRILYHQQHEDYMELHQKFGT